MQAVCRWHCGTARRVSRVMQGFPPESLTVRPEPNQGVTGYLSHHSTFTLQPWLRHSDALRQPAEDLQWSPLLRCQPGSILVKTHWKPSPPGQNWWGDYEEMGLQTALKYWGYLFILPAFVVVSFRVMIKGKWEKNERWKCLLYIVTRVFFLRSMTHRGAQGKVFVKRRV